MLSAVLRRWFCVCCPWRKCCKSRRTTASSVVYTLVSKSPDVSRRLSNTTVDCVRVELMQPPVRQSVATLKPVAALRPLYKIPLSSVQLPIAGGCTGACILVACATQRTVSVANVHTRTVVRTLGPFDATPTAVTWAATRVQHASHHGHGAFVIGDNQGKLTLMPSTAPSTASMPTCAGLDVPDKNASVRVVTCMGSSVRALHYDARQDVLLVGYTVCELGSPCMAVFAATPLFNGTLTAPIGRAGSLCVFGRAVAGCMSVCADPVQPATAWMVEHADRGVGVRVGGFTFDGHPLQTLVTAAGGHATAIGWSSDHCAVVFEPEAVSVFTRSSAHARLVLTATWTAQRLGFQAFLPSAGMVAAHSVHSNRFMVWLIDEPLTACMGAELLAFPLQISQ